MTLTTNTTTDLDLTEHHQLAARLGGTLETCPCWCQDEAVQDEHLARLDEGEEPTIYYCDNCWGHNGVLLRLKCDYIQTHPVSYTHLTLPTICSV